MASNPSYSVGVDIGGTFTDVVFLNDATGALTLAKASTTPSDRSVGFLNGVEKGLEATGQPASSVGRIFHGSTVATNAVLEGKGARMGLVTTQGFGHILEIGRAYIPGIFTNHMRWEKPERLVPLELVREITERLDVRGNEIVAMDEAQARAAIEELVGSGIEALAISLIHSYVDPTHEEKLEAIAREIAPDLFVSRSSAVLPEYREYERTMTTVLNAYVMPVVDRYLQRIRQRLEERGISVDIQIMRSDAGVMSLQTALEQPVNTVLSGPAGGVRGATYLASFSGYPNILSMDMGGTSTDICLSVDEDPRLTTDTWVSHYPVKVPIIDITTIGAGGGSLAYVSTAGALRVGPQSAGADPGPACYGRGGTRPTVTDANVVLGRLPAELAGGEITLDVAAAREAVRVHVAEPLGLSIEEAAYGIIRIVNENMLGALRVVSVQRGIDPRELTLVPFGGAGPVHGGELAELLSIATMMVPPMPGVLSALGFLLSDVRNVFTTTKIGIIGKLDIEDYATSFAKLEAQAADWLVREGVAEGDRALEIAADLRYKGQAFEMPITLGAERDEATWTEVRTRFDAAHKQLYGYDQPFAEVEVVTLRVTAIGRNRKLSLPELAVEGEDSSAAKISEQPVYFGGEYVPTGIYDRAILRPGNVVDGPAIITQLDCTTVITPDQTMRVDQFGNLIVTAKGGSYGN